MITLCLVPNLDKTMSWKEWFQCVIVCLILDSAYITPMIL